MNSLEQHLAEEFGLNYIKNKDNSADLNDKDKLELENRRLKEKIDNLEKSIKKAKIKLNSAIVADDTSYCIEAKRALEVK